MTTKNMNTPPGSTQENEIDLLRLVGELWDHRKFIISVTALFTLIAVAYSLLSTPIYQADTLVQVEQKQGNAILSGLSDMIPNSSPESAPEIQLLQSRMILGKTIAELNLRDIVEQKYFPIVGRGWARLTKEKRHCCKVSDEAAFCLIQRPYISKTLLTRRISPRGSP